MKHRIQFLALFTCAVVSSAFGQSGASVFSSCQNSSSTVYNKLVCQFPFSVGLYNDATALGESSSSATPSAAVVATIFNSAIATQVSQLPVSTATAGTVLLYENGAYQTYHNQGPILTDRPQTVGRYHHFWGFSASQYVFNSIDGQSLKALNFAYARTAVNGTTTYTSEQTKLSFRLNQFVAIGTFGLTDRIDVSAILPIERVSLGASASGIENWGVTGSSSFGPYATTLPYAAGTASGVGDLLINVKYLAWNGASGKAGADQPASSGAGRANVAMGVNFREPIGDDLNLLGSGAFGVNPYVVASYMATVSPHAKIGYQWNGTTELNPSIVTTTTIAGSGTTTVQTTGANQSLPGGYVYDIGADWAANKKLTIAADLLGNQYLNSTVLSNAPTAITLYQTAGTLPTNVGCSSWTTNKDGISSTLTCSTSTYSTSSYTINKLATGVKWNPVWDMVFSANVLTQLNNNGLRSRPVPLLGVAYKF